MQLLLRHDFFKDMLAALCALKLSFFARLAKHACRSGDEVEVSFPRFGVRGYSESGLVPVRRPSWHTPPHTCLAEFSNYAELCTFEYAWKATLISSLLTAAMHRDGGWVRTFGYFKAEQDAWDCMQLP